MSRTSSDIGKTPEESSSDSVAEPSKAAVLAAISHELRTPLTALTGYGELLSDEILGPLTPLQRDTIERMRTVTHHLASMVDSLLTFSKLETGRERVLRTEVDLSIIVRDVIAVVEPLARKRRIQIITPPVTVAPVRTDADKLRHVLVNLVDNAVKFTEEGSVTLSIMDDGALIRCTVADTGIGIAPEQMPLLFHPFAQLDAGLTRRYGGAGLGLYVAKGLAELLGGAITVTSEQGKGSTFVLTIPRAVSH